MLRPGEDSIHALERHGRGDLMRYRRDVFDDKYARLRGDRPCKTIVAHLAKDGNGYIHPTQVRSISLREAARVQSFHDGYIFCGSPVGPVDPARQRRAARARRGDRPQLPSRPRKELTRECRSEKRQHRLPATCPPPQADRRGTDQRRGGGDQRAGEERARCRRPQGHHLLRGRDRAGRVHLQSGTTGTAWTSTRCSAGGWSRRRAPRWARAGRSRGWAGACWARRGSGASPRTSWLATSPSSPAARGDPRRSTPSSTGTSTPTTP